MLHHAQDTLHISNGDCQTFPGCKSVVFPAPLARYCPSAEQCHKALCGGTVVASYLGRQMRGEQGEGSCQRGTSVEKGSV
jgi:hypothetical protein